MENESLLYFETPDDLNKFVDDLDIRNGWKIQKGLMNDRGTKIEDKWYFKYLRSIFWEKKMFRMQASKAEIVTWLDNLILMNRVLSKLKTEVPKESYEAISVACEYKIELSKKMRVDYVIMYKDNMLVLEFRTINSFDYIRDEWRMKFNELLIYKELMGNYFINKNIRLYAFIALYEFSGSKRVPPHMKYNKDQINHLCRYIEKFIL